MGCEPSYLYPRLNADEVYLQVVVLFQHIDNGLLLCREVRKERPLFVLLLGIAARGRRPVNQSSGTTFTMACRSTTLPIM